MPPNRPRSAAPDSAHAKPLRRARRPASSSTSFSTPAIPTAPARTLGAKSLRARIDKAAAHTPSPSQSSSARSSGAAGLAALFTKNGKQKSISFKDFLKTRSGNSAATASPEPNATTAPKGKPALAENPLFLAINRGAADARRPAKPAASAAAATAQQLRVGSIDSALLGSKKNAPKNQPQQKHRQQKPAAATAKPAPSPPAGSSAAAKKAAKNTKGSNNSSSDSTHAPPKPTKNTTARGPPPQIAGAASAAATGAANRKGQRRGVSREEDAVPAPTVPEQEALEQQQQQEQQWELEQLQQQRLRQHQERYDLLPRPGHFSIKHASLPPILILRNLAAGTSTDDVRTVVQALGAVQRCRTQARPDGTVAAEVVFLDRSMADIAAHQFDGALADGRVIYANVTKVQTIPDPDLIADPQADAAAGAVAAELYQEELLQPVVRESPAVAEPVYVNSWEGPPLHSDMVVLRRTRPIMRQ